VIHIYEHTYLYVHLIAGSMLSCSLGQLCIMFRIVVVVAEVITHRSGIHAIMHYSMYSVNFPLLP